MSVKLIQKNIKSLEKNIKSNSEKIELLNTELKKDTELLNKFTKILDKYNDIDNSNDEMIMSSDGLLDREKIAQFKTKCKDNFNKDGQILWDCVVSLSSFEYAEKCGLLNHSDYASVVAKVLPKFYKTIGLDPNNMLWWETYHANTNNPHMHICFFEKNQTRQRGKINQSELDYLKK